MIFIFPDSVNIESGLNFKDQYQIDFQWDPVLCTESGLLYLLSQKNTSIPSD